LNYKNDLERDHVEGCARRLRAKEISVSRKYVFTKWVTPWEADDFEFRARDAQIVFDSTLSDMPIVITGDPSYEDKDKVVVYARDIVVLQFAGKEMIDSVLKVYKTFGKVRLGDFRNPDLDKVVAYCNEIDNTILKEFNELRSQPKGVRDVFSKIWHELGGDKIRPEDRLGQRIKYYKNLIAAFQKDKEKWRPMLIEKRLMEIKK